MFKLLFSLGSCLLEVGGLYLSRFFVTRYFRVPRALQAALPSAARPVTAPQKGAKEEGGADRPMLFPISSSRAVLADGACQN